MHKVVATSQSESENELFGGSRQLPPQLAARSPTVAFNNSSDAHIDPLHQNNAPVTVNQYITVIDEVEPFAGNTYQYIDAITPQPPEGENRVGKNNLVIETFH
jgi:hypothetical protein